MSSICKSLIIFALAAAPGLCADWSPRLAAEYLDSRQKEWAAWPGAKATGGTCVSCHTGLTYLFARPALRQVLGEARPTAYEDALRTGLRARLDRKEPKDKSVHAAESLGVESIFAALFLASDEMTPEATQAFDRMWALQIREGDAKGAWAWFSLDLDPWEMPDSRYFGATLAVMAIAATPASYRSGVQEQIADLTSYLQRERKTQPLHNRLMVLWASTKLPEVLPASERNPIVEEVWRAQRPDGGWSLESLGPWKKRTTAPASEGGNAYATGLAALVLEKAGVTPNDPRMKSALAWLRSHQDPAAGSWSAESMNKMYEKDSMQIRFMRDAATAFAALALLETQQVPVSTAAR